MTDPTMRAAIDREKEIVDENIARILGDDKAVGQLELFALGYECVQTPARRLVSTILAARTLARWDEDDAQ